MKILKIKPLKPLTFLTAAALILGATNNASADYQWTVADGIGGWTAANINMESVNTGTDDMLWRSNGFTDGSALDSLTTIENGALVSTGNYVKTPWVGNLSGYIGGTLTIGYSDSWLSSFSVELPPAPYVEGLLLSGTVGGKKVILNYNPSHGIDANVFPINHEGGTTKSGTLGIQLVATDFDNVIIQQFLPDMAPTYSISTSMLTSLSENEFRELMSNLDGIYFRSAADTPTMVDSGNIRWITQIDSASLAMIPEPSAYAMLLGVGGLAILAIRRRNSRR